jgi:hypothetical protein
MVFNPFYSIPFDYVDNQSATGFEQTIPRFNIGSAPALVSQTLVLTYWTAIKTMPINNLYIESGSQAAGATPTYCAVGFYLVDSNSNLTLQGQCANDTTLFSTTFTGFSRAITTPYMQYQGNRYACGILVVSGATMPILRGYNGIVSHSTATPRLSAQLSGQSTLPTSILNSAVSGVSNMYLTELSS